MAPTTNPITTAITDALSQALTIANPTSTVNLNITNIINPAVQVHPPPNSSSDSDGPIDPATVTVVGFSASWSNIFLGLVSFIELIMFIYRFISQKAWNHGWWPKNTHDKLLDISIEQLRVLERMENSIETIVHAQHYHFEYQERQMDRLLQQRGIKDRPCLHRDEEPCGPRCSSSSSALEESSSSSAWGEGWGMGEGWSDWGSQERLIPEKVLREGLKPEQKQLGGIGKRGELKLVEVPSGWTKVSHCRVENQSVTDWASEEKVIWLGGNVEGQHAVYLDPATSKFKSA